MSCLARAALLLLASLRGSRALKKMDPHMLLEYSVSPWDLLQEYEAQHGLEAVRGEFVENTSAICGRRFVWSHYSCGDGLGSTMSAFLNAFAFAVLTNRTLMVATHEPSAPGRSKCEDHLALSRALMVPSDVYGMRAEAQCEDVDEVSLPSSGGDGAGFWKCCDFEALAGRVARVRSVARPAAAWWSLANERLGASANARAHALLDRGPFHWLGTLFQAAFDLKQSVRAPVDDMLEQVGDAIRIGVHLHFDSYEQALSDAAAYGSAKRCVAQVAARHRWQRCAVLVASREERAILKFKQELSELQPGCTVLASPMSLERGIDEDPGWPWKDLSEMMDMYMLSKAHVLIGSGRSAFLEVAAGMFAAEMPGRLKSAVYEHSSCMPMSLEMDLHAPGNESCGDVVCPLRPW